MIYAIRNPNTGSVKIGFSNKPKQRLAGLQTGHDVELVLESYIRGNRKWERGIHRILRGERVRGEWFRGELTNTMVLIFSFIGKDVAAKDQRAFLKANSWLFDPEVVMLIGDGPIEQKIGRLKSLISLRAQPLERRLAFVEAMKARDWDQPQDMDELEAEINLTLYGAG